MQPSGGGLSRQAATGSEEGQNHLLRTLEPKQKVWDSCHGKCSYSKVYNEDMMKVETEET